MKSARTGPRKKSGKIQNDLYEPGWENSGGWDRLGNASKKRVILS